MSSVVISGNTSGAVTISAPAVAGTVTVTLPSTSGTMLTTASSGQSIPKAALPTGSVLQVVSTTKTDTFSAAGAGVTTWADVTGLSVSITPTSTSSKILVFASFAGVANPSTGCSGRITRNGTAISVATSTGNRTAGSVAEMFNTRGDSFATFTVNYLDSPASVSAVTYAVQVAAQSGTTTYINRSIIDTDSSSYTRATSTIIVMEIAA